MVATEESVARDCITILFLCLFILFPKIVSFPNFPFSHVSSYSFSSFLFSIPPSLSLSLSLSLTPTHISLVPIGRFPCRTYPFSLLQFHVLRSECLVSMESWCPIILEYHTYLSIASGGMSPISQIIWTRR